VTNRASMPMPSPRSSQSADAEVGADEPAVRLFLPAVPASVALARQALTGFAETLGIDDALVADMKIAVTEACTNTVVHAYDEGGGPLEVAIATEPGRLVVTVVDGGHGLRPLPAMSEGPPLGFGLALIASLSDEFGIAGGRHGTAVRIAFALAPGGQAAPLVVQLGAERTWPPERIVVTLGAGAHAAPVLSRVVSLVAARADFSIDRLSDAQIVSDAIAGAAGAHALDGTLRVAIDEHERGFDLVIGPLVPDGGRQLIQETELPGLGCLLERLTDTLAVEPPGDPQDGERLRIRLDARR
jgi:serine/threonine-protein kinase RsbW